MMDEVVGFMLAMMIGTGVAFELPVILGGDGLAGAHQLEGRSGGSTGTPSSWRSSSGGVLTPGPDVLSQVLMSAPLFGLYNVSILIVWMIERAARKRLAALAKETGADLVPPTIPTLKRRLAQRSASRRRRKNLTAPVPVKMGQVINAGRIL